MLKKHTPSRRLATPELLWGPNPTACQLDEVTWWRLVQRNPDPAMTWDYKHLLAFNDPHTTHWWLARDLPCRLEIWVKPDSSLVLNKDMLALLEQTATECEQLPTHPALSGHTTLASAHRLCRVVWTQLHVGPTSLLKDFILTQKTVLFFKFTPSLIAQLSKAWQRNQSYVYVEAANHIEKRKAEGSSKQFYNSIHVQSRTAMSPGSAATWDPPCCFCGAVVAGGSIVALGPFQEPALSSGSQGSRGAVTPQDSTRQGCMLSRHANHLIWPNIKAQLPSKTGFLQSLPSHSLTFSSINSKPFARSWFCQEERKTCICLLFI